MKSFFRNHKKEILLLLERLWVHISHKWIGSFSVILKYKKWVEIQYCVLSIVDARARVNSKQTPSSFSFLIFTKLWKTPFNLIFNYKQNYLSNNISCCFVSFGVEVVCCMIKWTYKMTWHFFYVYDRCKILHFERIFSS